MIPMFLRESLSLDGQNDQDLVAKLYLGRWLLRLFRQVLRRRPHDQFLQKQNERLDVKLGKQNQLMESETNP